MPSLEHEALVGLIREHTQLVTELLPELFDIELPDHARVEPADTQLSQAVSTSRSPDLVLKLVDSTGKPLFAVVVEVQLTRDREKRRAWPWYVAKIHVDLRCATQLLVVTSRSSVARWSKLVTASFQPSSPFVPLVLGPGILPRITDPTSARQRPHLAILSALVHGRARGSEAVAVAVMAALEALDSTDLATYDEIVWRALGQAARRSMEEQMREIPLDEYTAPWIRRGIDKGLAQGREEGRAEGLAVLRSALTSVLVARNLPIDAKQRARIHACTDAALLGRCLTRAATATTADGALEELTK